MHKPNVITEIMNQDDANAKQAADCEASHGYIDPGKQGDLRGLVKFEKKIGKNWIVGRNLIIRVGALYIELGVRISLRTPG